MRNNKPIQSISRQEPRPLPALRFSPTAWAKLLFLRDAGETEVGGFGITSANDLLLVEDVQLVQQSCDMASVAFDDESVADYFDRQVDAGLKPEQFGRIWLHTHPGDGPRPSNTDEATFARVFGRTQWAVMFILARGGSTYARLRFHVGPGGDVELPVSVDYSQPFPASDHAAWQAEYAANVQEMPLDVLHGRAAGRLANDRRSVVFDDDWLSSFPDAVDDPIPIFADEEFCRAEHRNGPF